MKGLECPGTLNPRREGSGNAGSDLCGVSQGVLWLTLTQMAVGKGARERRKDVSTEGSRRADLEMGKWEECGNKARKRRKRLVS